MNTSRVLHVVVLMAGLGFLTACEHDLLVTEYRFLQPDKVINKPEQASVQWIVDSMSALDKSEELYPNAVFPTKYDIMYVEEDYRIGPADVLDISIFDLYAEGLETQLQRVVSDSGYIDLPLLEDRIRAEGLTSVELTKVVKDAYSPNVLRDPQISVNIAARRQQTFSILGAVQRPGTYNLTRPDMRLLDAIALAGGVFRSDIEYLYVIRQTRPQRVKPSQVQQNPAPEIPVNSEMEPSAPARGRREQLEQLNDLIGRGRLSPAEAVRRSGGVVTLSETGGRRLAQADNQPRWIYRDGKWVQVEGQTEEPADEPSVEPAPPAEEPDDAPAEPPAIEPAEPTVPDQPIAAPPTTQPRRRAVPTPPSRKRRTQDPFGWAEDLKEDQVRVIAINYEKLKQGDYRQNIVIRENDIVRIPVPEQGEFYMMGEVLRPGVYSLTGRKITVKQAVAAAGNLGALAWPANSVLIRRVGRNQEQMIPLNIEKIVQGEDPDVYLKPDDVIAVGTHWSTSFLAVIRNAFRMTYGFGLIYDRNFSDPLLITPNSRRFKAW